MEYIVLARLHFAGVDRHRSPGIDENDAGGGMRLIGHELLFLVERRSLKVRDPVVEKVIGLGFERIGANGHDRVGEFGVLVAIIEFAYSHVSGGVHLGIVSRSIVDPDVLDLHRAEIQLPRAPGVFVTAAGAAMVEH